MKSEHPQMKNAIYWHLLIKKFSHICSHMKIPFLYFPENHEARDTSRDWKMKKINPGCIFDTSFKWKL